MLTIRLSRIGKKNKPMYRLVISEKARDTKGRSLEILGSYNPHTKVLDSNNERIQYWISQGSGLSVTVNNLLIEKGVIKGEKLKATKVKTKKAAQKAQQETEAAASASDKTSADQAKAEKEKAKDEPKAEAKTEAKTDKPAEENKVTEPKAETAVEPEKESQKPQTETEEADTKEK